MKRWPLVLTAVAIFIGIWWIGSIMADSVLLPTPWQALVTMVTQLKAPHGWEHFWITTGRVFLGTFMGCVAGTFLGTMTRYNRLVEITVRTVICPVLQSIPTICWALMFILWFGLNRVTPALTVAVAVAPFFIINIWEGMKELDDNLIEMASTYTHSRFKLFRKIVWPMLYPYVFAATRSSFMTAWKIVVPAEIFGATSGMGYMLSLAFDMYRIEGVFGWTLVFAVIIIVFDYGLFNFLDRKYMRKWKPQELKPS
jgi:ABC-type nitrate/sulfonate/bicarbonate transport system permease component